DFNFYPNTPVRLFGTEAGVMELPTIPSDIEQLKVNVTSLLAKINRLPLEKMSDQIINAIADADQLLKDADGVVKSGGGLVGNVNGQVQPLTASIIGTSAQANSFLKEARERLELKPGEPLLVLNQ